MNVKYCDLCEGEISDMEEPYHISYGKQKQGMFGGKANLKSGEICAVCCKNIHEFVQGLKK